MLCRQTPEETGLFGLDLGSFHLYHSTLRQIIAVEWSPRVAQRSKPHHVEPDHLGLNLPRTSDAGFQLGGRSIRHDPTTVHHD